MCYIMGLIIWGLIISALAALVGLAVALPKPRQHVKTKPTLALLMLLIGRNARKMLFVSSVFFLVWFGSSCSLQLTQNT